jgi:hypothetical protein
VLNISLVLESELLGPITAQAAPGSQDSHDAPATSSTDVDIIMLAPHASMDSKDPKAAMLKGVVGWLIH